MGKWKDLMIQGMEIKGLAESTIYNYTLEMRKLIKHYKKDPSKLKLEDLILYQHFLVKNNVSKCRFKMSVASMRYFYKHTCPMEWDIESVHYQKEAKRLPVVFSKDEIQRILSNTIFLKHRIIILFAYSAGLRMSEVLNLKVADIDSDRMLIHVHLGKGLKDRYTPLSPRLLEYLREYYKQDRHLIKDYLFPGRNGRMERTGSRKSFKKCLKRAGITKYGTFHTLRHSFATHLLEDGINLLVVQKLLGHCSIKTTMIYLHVATNYIVSSHSPLDTLYFPTKKQDDR
ncbi:MAG: tyrosine-type recombinase/integrase [Immundisolibacteraceae bacterium]|nr:tyrosine-type recombinase/integrase [Immundisolibacteraceae bacterium]